MIKFLAIVRRTLLIGIIALVSSIFVLHKEITRIFAIVLNANAHIVIRGILAFFLLCPILYVLFGLISVAYIMKKGQFAVVHQQHSFLFNFGRMIGSDISSPVRQIFGIFMWFKKQPEWMPEEVTKTARKQIIGRFFMGIMFIVMCALSIGILYWNL